MEEESVDDTLEGDDEEITYKDVSLDAINTLSSMAHSAIMSINDIVQQTAKAVVAWRM
jgi:hypothetical protein